MAIPENLLPASLSKKPETFEEFQEFFFYWEPNMPFTDHSEGVENTRWDNSPKRDVKEFKLILWNASKIKKSEGKINWNNKAENIIGKINGLYPSPGAWFIYKGERFKILKAEISERKGKAGIVLDEYYEVACNNKSIKILEIQREGKRPQKINEFMLGSQIKVRSNLNNA